ncbi:MAG: hypothetical protein AAGG75_12960 [Bacteroidota bacterium]
MAKYALLFSGMSNKRHVDDVEFIYRVLINKYQYPAANILVFNLNGTLSYRNSNNQNVITSLSGELWPGNNTPYTLVVNGSGEIDPFLAGFQHIGSKLSSQDTFFLHVNNHGGNSGKPDEPVASYICTYGGGDGNDWGPAFTEQQMQGALQGMNSCQDFIVLMEQCYSGGFKNVVCNHANATQVSFAAAATYNRASSGQWEWDAFAKDWISAVNGANPDGSALVDPPSSQSMTDCFNWAKKTDRTGDNPVYLDQPSGAGANMYL